MGFLEEMAPGNHVFRDLQVVEGGCVFLLEPLKDPDHAMFCRATVASRLEGMLNFVLRLPPEHATQLSRTMSTSG